jgi:hypothetical protein
MSHGPLAGPPPPAALFRAYLRSIVPSCRGVNKTQMTLDNENGRGRSCNLHE